MFVRINFLFLLCFTAFGTYAQKTAEYTGSVVALKTSYAMKERCTNYKKTMHIADSLLVGYLMEPFLVETENKGTYESGSSYLLDLYNTAQRFKPKSDEAKTKVTMMEDLIQKEKVESEAKEYNKILAKAEEYYAKGNLDKAIELYERAVSFKPSDEHAKERLIQLKALKQ